MDTHPTKSVLEPCWEHGRTKLNSFGWVGDSSARKLGLSNLTHSCTVPLPATPPWLFPMPTVELEMIKKSKQCNEFGGMNSLIQQYISDKYNGSIQIFTDGLKHPDTGKTDRVGAPPIPTSKKKKKRNKALFYRHIKTHV